MSTSKRIDVICAVALLCTLLITVIFMNGTSFGIQAVADADAETEDSHFTANDLNGDWDTSGATRVTLTGDGGSVKGNGAYVYDGDVHIIYAGKYVLSGELTNGSVIVDADGDDKIWLMLDGADLHCDDSAAIVVEQAKKVFLTLAPGSVNTVSSGAVYSDGAVANGIDGAIYSRDDLTINGSGALTVTADYKHGIVGNDDLVITGGTIDVTAPQDGIHANDSVRIAQAHITITAGDDGVTVSNDDETAYFYMESGTLNIPACYEGVEAIDVTIAGGTIDIRPTDDGVNANGRGQKSIIRVTGGDITIINETGRDADGLDSNGSIDISGGNIFISVNTSSYALDCGSENGGTCTISGGTVIAAGGSAMAEGFEEDSSQAFLMSSVSNAAAGTVVTLTNQAGETLASATIPCAFSSIIISTPEMTLGDAVTLTVGDSVQELTVDNSTSGGGFGGMGGRGGRGGLGGDGLGARGGWTGEMPQGDFERGNGFRGQMGDGEMPAFADGEMPARPDGEMPTRPDGEMPTRPDGEMPDFSDDEMPTRPDGQENGQDGMQFPGRGQGGMGGNRWGGDGMNGGQFGQWGQDADGVQADAQGETSGITAEALILVGLSTLALLAGLLIAFKTKH